MPVALMELHAKIQQLRLNGEDDRADELEPFLRARIARYLKGAV